VKLTGRISRGIIQFRVKHSPDLLNGFSFVPSFGAMQRVRNVSDDISQEDPPRDSFPVTPGIYVQATVQATMRSPSADQLTRILI
jgi:hypothetical protein